MQRLPPMPSIAAGLTGAALLLASAPLAAQARRSASPSTSAAASPAPTKSSTAPAKASTAPVKASTAPAQASPVALAERYAEEAFQAYARKDFDAAVELYQKALAAAPSADIVYNLARVYDLGLRDPVLAMRFYTRYLDEPGAVQNLVETARQRLAELRAELGARAPAPAAPVVAPEPEEARSGSALPALAFISGGLGLAAVGVGVGFGIAAKSHLDESQRYCDDNACTSQRGVDAAHSAARAADVATLGFAAGGALLALGTVFWLVSDSEPEPAAAGDTRWSPRVTPKEVSLSVSGSFAGL